MTIAILLATPCFAQLLPLIKLKTSALSIKYENDSSLQMSKLDYEWNYPNVSQLIIVFLSVLDNYLLIVCNTNK